jgi:hypothetical protein
MDGSLAHRRREIGVRKVLFSVATKALLALDSFLFLYLYIDKWCRFAAGRQVSRRCDEVWKFRKRVRTVGNAIYSRSGGVTLAIQES